jgi:hypothetical protein
LSRLGVLVVLLLVLAACSPHPDRLPRDDDGLAALKARIQADGGWRCDSLGGSLKSGLLLGYFLRERRLPVEIGDGDRCISAAAIAALGSPMLIKSARGALVFHGPQRSLDPFERANVEMSLVLWEVPEPLRRRIMALAPDEYWSHDVAALQILLAARR